MDSIDLSFKYYGYSVQQKSSMLFLLIVISIFIWFLIVFVNWLNRRRYFMKLASNIPGPSTVPFFGNALIFAAQPQEAINIVNKLIQQYDRNIFRLWIGNRLSIIVTKPEDIEAILGNTKQFSKSQQYDIMRPLMGDGLFTSKNQNVWKYHRKLLSPAFHFTILKGFVTIFCEEATILANKIESKVGHEIDIYPLVGLCTLDAICRTAMGVSVKAQNENGGDFVQSLETVFKVWQQRMAKCWLSIPLIFAFSSLKREHDTAVKSTLNFTDKVIQEKHKQYNDDDKHHKKLEEGGKLAFLDLMLGNGMTDTQLRDETMTIIIGGQETTATELSFALLLIAIHEDIQEKVIEELDCVFGDDKLSPPSLHDLNKLEYMERVIKETMRLYPALPAVGRRLENDVTVGDYIIPKGSDVGIFIYGTHRDPNYWKDPLKFNPDNFLPDNCRQRHPYSFMPFSAGLRNCIGQKYGMFQMKTVLSTLLRRYRITSNRKDKSSENDEEEEIETIMTTTLKSKNAFRIIFNYR